MIERVTGLADRTARPRLQERVLPFDALPREARPLALLGYAALGLLVAAVLAGELFGRHLPGVTFDDGSKLARAPVLIVGLSGAAWAAGWAFLLTGACCCRPAVFAPAALLFLLESALMAAHEPSLLLLGLPLLAAVTAAIPLAAAGRRGRAAHWSGRAAPRFLLWLTAAALLLALLSAAGESPAPLAAVLSVGRIFTFMLLVVPFAVLLGVEAVDGAMQAGRWAVTRLRPRLRERTFRRLPAPLLLALAVAAAVPVSLGQGTLLGEALLWPWLLWPALLLGAAAAWAAGRWSGRAAALLLALTVASLPFGLALALALRGSSLAEAALAATGLFPPAFLFALMTAFDALNFGPRFARGDSRMLPREARPYLYFGAAVLVLGYALLALNSRVVATGQPDQEVQDFANAVVATSILLLGLPYVAWTAWRRRERLTGPEPELVEFAGLSPQVKSS